MKDHTEKIDNYILGRLSPKEEEGFAQELKSNPDMTILYKQRLLLLEGIEAQGDIELKKRLKDIHKKFEGEDQAIEKSGGPGRSIFLLLAAATLAALAYFFYSQDLKPVKMEDEKIYASSYEPYEFSSGTRSDEADKSFGNAVAQYNNKEYDAASNSFEKLLTLDSQNLEYKFGYALSKLLGSTPEEGKDLMQLIISKNDPVFKDQAIWFLGLAELKSGNREKAKQLFMTLSKDSQADHHKDAIDALNKMGK